MSTIQAFAFENILALPRTCCECVPVVTEDVIRYSRVPAVSSRWTAEKGPDGTRNLVQHWFKNEERSESVKRTRRQP